MIHIFKLHTYPIQPLSVQTWWFSGHLQRRKQVTQVSKSLYRPIIDCAGPSQRLNLAHPQHTLDGPPHTGPALVQSLIHRWCISKHGRVTTFHGIGILLGEPIRE